MTMTRGAGAMTIQVDRQPGEAGPALIIAPALPLDAQLADVRVNGRPVRSSIAPAGDVQFVEVVVEQPAPRTTATFRYTGGSDVYVHTAAPLGGARSEGLRILRSRADAGALRVLVEGRGGHSYDVFLRTARAVASVNGAQLQPSIAGRDPVLRVTVDGAAEEYSKRDIVVTFAPGRASARTGR